MGHKASYSLGKDVLRGEGEGGLLGGFQGSFRNFAAHGWATVSAGVAGELCQARWRGSINASQTDLWMDTWGVSTAWYDIELF